MSSIRIKIKLFNQKSNSDNDNENLNLNGNQKLLYAQKNKTHALTVINEDIF